MTVESLSKYTNDSKFRSPKECLEDCIKDIGKIGAFQHGQKLLVLCLDDTDDKYDVSFSQAGMNMSECLALLEVSKSLFLHQMGYNEYND